MNVNTNDSSTFGPEREDSPETADGDELLNKHMSDLNICYDFSQNLSSNASSHLSMLTCPEESRKVMITARQFVRRQFSTTSSVYAEHTIRNPDLDQVLFCLATVIQAQMIEDNSNLTRERRAMYPQFNFSPDLSLENGGQTTSHVVSEEVLRREAGDDASLRALIQNHIVPSVDFIFKFLSYLQVRTKYPVECNIIGAIYLNRVTYMSNIPVTRHNWQMLWTLVIIISQKVWDDNSFKVSSVVDILPGTTKAQLRELEYATLCLLQFSMAVSPSLYAKYYFEFRKLFYDIVGIPNVQKKEFPLKPLSMRYERKLEDRSKRSLYKGRGHTSDKHKHHSRTKSYEDEENTDTSRYVIS